MKKIYLLLFLIIISCSKTEENDTVTSYFPPIDSTVWETKTTSELNWNQNNVQDLLSYLEAKNTKGFIILIDGKIALESYFDDHTVTSNNTWNSAAKTLTGLTVGIAQQEGFLNINDKTSNYLGLHWTSLSDEKENLITIKNQLSMTSGLDDTNFANTTPSHLTYLADAGLRWSYHNSPYTLLQNVVANATNQDFNTYFNAKIKNKIGMDGFWFNFGFFKLFTSSTRSMARFGLLILNKGKWNTTEILTDTNYFTQMTTASQNINNAYGYLWWLNGKNNFMLPQTQQFFAGSMIPNAPNDMFMALGKNDQKIYVVPSKNMVIVRMGDLAIESTFSLSEFDNELWEKINLVIN